MSRSNIYNAAVSIDQYSCRLQLHINFILLFSQIHCIQLHRIQHPSKMASFSVPPITGGPNQVFAKMFMQNQFRFKPSAPPASTSFVGKTAIITGSNSGLGLAAAQLMIEHGLSHLIMGVRTVSKGEKVAEPLRTKYSSATIEVWQLDMVSYTSVQAFAQKCASLSRIDAVILNAGVAQSEFLLSPHKHEETFQVNYLSTALLSLLLLPILKEKRQPGAPARMTIVASGMALTSQFPNRDAVPLIPSFDDPAGWGVSAAVERYGVSKTLVLMLVQKLSEAVSERDVIINCVEPGMIKGTGLQSHSPALIRAMFGVVKLLAARPVEQGAWAYIDAVDGQGADTHGGLVLECKLAP